jgi:RecB family exonuclease
VRPDAAGPEEVTPALLLGRARHALLQAAFERHLAGAGFPGEGTLAALAERWLPRGLYERERDWQAAVREVVRQVAQELDRFHPAERTCLAVEVTCSFPAPEALLIGRVDRLDLLADGGLEITEYKGGREPQTHGMQSALLHLLVAWTYRDRPEYRPIRVTLVHLPTGQRDTALLCREELVQVRLRIVRALHLLATGDVAPQPGAHCAWCPFASPAWCPAFVEASSWDDLDALL